MLQTAVRGPLRGAGGLVRARVRADVHGKDEEGRRPARGEPNQTSRAALLVPGPALRHLWRLSVAGRQRLKCVRTDPGFSPGRARPPPGCRGTRPLARRTREAEDPGPTVAKGRPSTASTERRSRDPRPPTLGAANLLTGEPPRPKPMPPRSRTPPEAPLADGTGRRYDRCLVLVKDFFLSRLSPCGITQTAPVCPEKRPTLWLRPKLQPGVIGDAREILVGGQHRERSS